MPRTALGESGCFGTAQLKQDAIDGSRIDKASSRTIRELKFPQPLGNQTFLVFGGKSDSLLTLFRPKTGDVLLFIAPGLRSLPGATHI
ncbi:hypothetical protein [Aquiflexum balticum]|uniref:hypothetical protein n=1 Tax=Aquiflexum balticum TaxID=280473 RepID=UPI000A03281C|nr:hypothetical protein [Aquiflexum balticum]